MFESQLGRIFVFVMHFFIEFCALPSFLQVTNPFNESFEQYLDHTYNPHLDSMNRFNYRLLTYVRDMFNFR